MAIAEALSSLLQGVAGQADQPGKPGHLQRVPADTLLQMMGAR